MDLKIGNDFFYIEESKKGNFYIEIETRFFGKFHVNEVYETGRKNKIMKHPIQFIVENLGNIYKEHKPFFCEETQKWEATEELFEFQRVYLSKK